MTMELQPTSHMSTLYKFIASPDAVRFLLNGVVKFTPIPELNDPSELMPSMDRQAVRESLKRLRSEGYSDDDMEHLRQQGNLLQTLAPEFQAVRVPATKSDASRLIRSSFYDSMSTLEYLLAETAREMSSKVGLFCLSKRVDSLPMWAHYAANATGLAVEFEGIEQVFSGDETGVLRQPTQIAYQRESFGVTFDPQSHRSLFFAKFQDWSYEQEVRVVLPLSECQKQTISEMQLYTYQIPKTCIARVVLGWNMSPANKMAVEERVKKDNPDVKISHAVFSKGRVCLVPAPQATA